MEEQKDFISFEVNETLYFEHGQEISEMQSISLDPDISLQMYQSYVQIRGLILLTGTYKKDIESIVPEKEKTEDEVTAYIEKIVGTSEDEANFTHRFPIDISIPRERIDSMEDVTVLVDAFDYELPDSHTLKIIATVHINGLKVELKEETKSEMEEINSQTEEPRELVEVKETEVQQENVNEKENLVDEHIGMESDKSKNERKEIDIQLNESETDEEEDEKVKDVRFLTDLFGGIEEETQTTITIYIAQEEDTIESIAKRFEMPTLELMKDNQLSGESIKEGQLLHITRK